MLKIAKVLIIKLYIIKSKHISSRPSNHSEIPIFLLRRYVVPLQDVHHKPARLVINAFDITLSCCYYFTCHSLFFFMFIFFVVIIVLKEQPFTIRILFIELVQVLRELITDIEQIVEVGDILPT